MQYFFMIFLPFLPGMCERARHLYIEKRHFPPTALTCAPPRTSSTPWALSWSWPWFREMEAWILYSEMCSRITDEDYTFLNHWESAFPGIIASMNSYQFFQRYEARILVNAAYRMTKPNLSYEEYTAYLKGLVGNDQKWYLITWFQYLPFLSEKSIKRIRRGLKILRSKLN